MGWLKDRRDKKLHEMNLRQKRIEQDTDEILNRVKRIESIVEIYEPVVEGGDKSE